MRFKRSQRIQELLLEEISKLLQSGLKDPRIGFATLTRVEVSDNLKHAKVFVSVMGSEEEKNQTLEALNAKMEIENDMWDSLGYDSITEVILKIEKFKMYRKITSVGGLNILAKKILFIDHGVNM